MNTIVVPITMKNTKIMINTNPITMKILQYNDNHESNNDNNAYLTKGLTQC